MKKFTLLATTVIALSAAPAMAHTGPYVGIVGGYDSVSLEVAGTSGSEDDVMYGVIAGYDIHYNGGAVVGVEAELADSSVGASDTDVFAAGDELSLLAARDIYVGVRAGFEVAEGTLLYAKGGYTKLLIKGAYDDGTGPVGGNESIEGYRLGAGVEHHFGPAGIRIEYRYSDYGQLIVAGTPTGVDASRHQVVAGVVFKF